MTSKFNLLLIAIYFCILSSSLGFSQTELCKIKPNFKPVEKKTLPSGFTIPTADYLYNYKQFIKEAKTSRVVVFNFFFDETNKFHKTAEDYLSYLKDSLGNLGTDIQMEFKVQKTQGSIFFDDKDKKLALIHLNALVYASDINVIKDLFGKGKEVRIDTSTSRTKAVTHEFVEIKSINSDATGYLYLFRAKLSGKGFACDPREDANILGMLSKIYNKDFEKDCSDRMEEEAKNKIDEKIKSLNDSLESYKVRYFSLFKDINKQPKWTIFSNIDFLAGGVKGTSTYTNGEINFKGRGISSTSGLNYFIDNAGSSGLFLSTALNVGSSTFNLEGFINHDYVQQESGYESMALLRNYTETIKSSMINVPLGIGYQFREVGWPIYFQFSAGALVGGNKLSSTQSDGYIDYKRKYPELGDVLVENLPAFGLVNDVRLNGGGDYQVKTAFTFGLYANLRVNYSFSKTSPLSGFMNFGYNGVKVKTKSNETGFISTELGEHNSLLNSMVSLPVLPIQVGVGIVYDLRKVINSKKK